MSRFHCCATCRHYAIVRSAEGTSYKCSRLGFATQPNYRFDCWNPKDNVRALMQDEGAQKKTVTPPQ